TVSAAGYDTGAVADVTTIGPDLDTDGIADVCDLDDDGDGNPDTTDPNPLAPTVTDDTNTGDPAVAVVTNVLTNDDYLPNNDPGVLGTTTLTQLTGDPANTSQGVVVVDPLTGDITYTPTITESGMDVVIVYEVCSDDGINAPICEQATLTITVSATDADMDGIPDVADLDDDNDGIADVDENPNGVDPSADDDGDGIPNYMDVDPDGDPSTPDLPDGNGDGIPDEYDADGDGIPNHFDLDGDNDGIPDVVETGNGDLDTDNDGDIDADDAVFSDTDNDGQADNTVGMTPLNTDGNPNDGPDFLDIDADDDGIPDNVEAQETGDYTAPSGIDGNMNGLDDAYEGAGFIESPTNTDGTDMPDYLDTDSDNDGVADVVEAGQGVPTGVDADADGLDDGFDDNIGTVGQPQDVNDNLDTGADGTNNTDNPVSPEVDFREIMDADMDGIPDVADLDDDNDGIADVDENPNGVDPSADDDGDGIPNYMDVDPDGDPSTPDLPDGNGDGIPDEYDADGDGIPNHFDLDGDNDGIPDVVETGNGDLDTDNDGDIDADDAVFSDTDNDGQADNTVGMTPLNTDGNPNDGPDFLDIDADDDGIPDNVEAQETGDYTAPSGIDGNMNGLDDAYEGAGFIESPTNTDGTDMPDYLDTDSDNDGVADVVEAGQGVPTGVDADADGLDDGFDDNIGTVGQPQDVNDNLDTGADGTNNTDNPVSPEVDFRETTDNDMDGIVDSLDLDDDNDGILDVAENPNGLDPTADSDMDGIPNFQDPDNGGDANGDGIADDFDADGDGVPNHFDLDADNDGIYDVAETGGTDANNDGRADDTDGNTMNNNGIPSTAGTGVDAPIDSDSATDLNSPDFLDTDSDGDGCNDADEAYENAMTDADDNGSFGTGVLTLGIGVNPDGTVTAASYDITTTGLENVIVSGPDIDGDGLAAACDDDDDGDGNPDTSDPNPDTPTANDDDATAMIGVPETINILENDDFLPDNLGQIGSDIYITDAGTGTGVGIVSFDENTGELIYTPAVGEGNMTVTVVYTVCNDITGDGASADDICATATVTVTVGAGDDNDMDGISNDVDLDDDNDGVLDTAENPNGFDPSADNDNDGIPNWQDLDDRGDGTPPVGNEYDNDNDGVPNHLDLDADNDGIYDVVEVGVADADNNGIADGLISALGVPSSAGTGVANPTDTDGNTTENLPDFLDADSDDDNCSDANEYYGDALTDGGDGGQFGIDPAAVNSNGTVIAAAYPATGVDIDGGGTADYVDATDDDLDQDGIANTCDDDDDGDGVPDVQELLDGTDPLEPCSLNLENQNLSTSLTFWYALDCDGDGVTNGDEIDPDGDGVLGPDETNLFDPCSFNPSDITLPVTFTGDCTSGLKVVKIASTTGTSVGDEITYTITVENTGNVDLTNVVLVDTFTDVNNVALTLTEEPRFVDSDLGSPEGQLLAGEIATYSARFIIDNQAVSASGVSNSVLATANTPSMTEVSDISDDGDDFDGNTTDDATITELGCMIVYNEFSPNDDGDNDTFIIGCIDRYPNNRLEVYNRWGNIVFKKNGYNNDWDGTSNGRSVVGKSETLPVGTYYYVLDLGDGSEPRVGWLYINR
ncbi:gliding motility-associated C-terminal domain-containing protein, partial [uncultured Algibacter sp.]|uniref:T9SS type B sorting domain-containing protein n=2 Tax=uncultured Algibacter sp. TaxID=298659 RepID=UPI0032170053